MIYQAKKNLSKDVWAELHGGCVRLFRNDLNGKPKQVKNDDPFLTTEVKSELINFIDQIALLMTEPMRGNA